METRQTAHRSTQCLGFGSSYEGWKLPDVDEVSEGDGVLDLPMRDGNGGRTDVMIYIGVRFGSSYEGWKQVKKNKEKRPKGRFGSSYEGWKRACSASTKATIPPVLDLPMRDGNSLPGAQQSGRWGVLDLPMRDGNWKRIWKRNQSLLVLDLPMRDGK